MGSNPDSRYEEKSVAKNRVGSEEPVVLQVMTTKGQKRLHRGLGFVVIGTFCSFVGMCKFHEEFVKFKCS